MHYLTPLTESKSVQKCRSYYLTLPRWNGLKIQMHDLDLDLD